MAVYNGMTDCFQADKVLNMLHDPICKNLTYFDRKLSRKVVSDCLYRREQMRCHFFTGKCPIFKFA
jgi:hypothetical protein